MQRVEAKRNSYSRDSSSEEDQQQQQQSLQKQQQNQLPPPPPPRDPHRRLQMIRNEYGRPVSYSFENSAHSPIIYPSGQDEPDDLGLPLTHHQPRLFVRPSPVNWQHNRPLSNSELYLADQGLLHYDPSQQLLHDPAYNFTDERYSSQPALNNTYRTNPPAQYWKSPPQAIPPQSLSSHSPLPQVPPRRNSSLDAAAGSRRTVRLDHPIPPKSTRSPSLDQRGEYWKSPPLNMNPPPPRRLSPAPIVIPPHYHDRARLAFSDHSRDCSPQRPLRKKLSTVSDRSRDSAVVVQTSCSSIEKSGKSSPSSVSSKDSGCSENVVKHQPQHFVRPLSAVIENEIVIANEAVQHDEERKKKELSPPRSFADDPGFSTKKRRSRFRQAMNELEDVLSGIQRDSDLLDRAERRDLPTAHQELKFAADLDTSKNDGEEDSSAAFSDLDNFMNWNTSSSFENVVALNRSRSRTPSNRRSGVYDKKNDDMAYRRCLAYNKPPGKNAPPVEQSYLQLNPYEFREEEKSVLDEDEPDTKTDDAAFRALRTKNNQNPLDPQPKFGIPKTPLGKCSDKDYLHAVPDANKYKSTFHPMRNPDVVRDDLAFRNLRKDENLRDPNQLGQQSSIPPSLDNCSHPKCVEKDEDKVPQEPYIFYPNRNNPVMKSVSDQIGELIRKQAGSASGGDVDKIITYQDLKNPDVYSAIKDRLNLIANGGEVEDGDEKENWQGKNLYQLLSSNAEEMLEKKKKINGSLNREVIVQHCSMESPLGEKALEALNRLEGIVVARRKSSERNHNDNKDDAEDEDKEKQKKQNRISLTESLDNERETEKERERSESESRFSRAETEFNNGVLRRRPKSEVVASKTADNEDGEERNQSKGEQQQQHRQPQRRGRNNQSMNSTSFDLHPMILFACYFLAFLHNFTGFDFLSALGVILAAVSVISVFFL